MSKRKVTAEQIQDSLAKWCTVLAERSAAIDTVPPGWFTTAQLADQTGHHIQITKRRVSKLVKLGRVERKNFRIALAKMVRPVPHYRLLGK